MSDTQELEQRLSEITGIYHSGRCSLLNYADGKCDCENGDKLKKLLQLFTTSQRQLLERVMWEVNDVKKYNHIPPQVETENPTAWLMYSEGKDSIFESILTALDKLESEL